MPSKIEFRVDDEQWYLINEAAKSLGMSPGQYCRHKALLDARIADLEVKIDARAEEIIQRVDETNKDALRKIGTWIVETLRKEK